MRIEVYGKKNCSYCTLAKTLLDKKGVPFTYTDVEENDFDLANLVTVTAPGAKSVPIVIIDGEWIGGYTDLLIRLK